MSTEVILPRVDMDMTEGKIACWYVKNGDKVSKGQVLFDIETDKAAMEVDAPADGVIQGIIDKIGEPLPVGHPVAWIMAPGETLTAASDATAQPSAAPSAPEPAAPAAIDTPAITLAPATVAAAVATGSGLLRATPLARSLAREHGVELERIEGSGVDGAILGRDVLGLTRPQAAQSLPDIHLYWWRRGTGTPVVLIHGFGADQGSWRPLAQQLGADLCVVAVDLPNHGKSSSRSVSSLQEIAGLVLQRLDQEGINACHVVGHSLGGGVSLAMAQETPRRIKSLTLLAPAGLGSAINGRFIDGLVQAEDETALKATMSLLFHDTSLLTSSFLATALQQLQRPGRREALASMAQQLMPNGVQGEILLEALNGVRVPTKVIWGANDRVIPASQAQAVPGRVALHLLPDVGHLPQVEASDLVAELVEQQVRAGS